MTDEEFCGKISHMSFTEKKSSYALVISQAFGHIRATFDLILEEGSDWSSVYPRVVKARELASAIHNLSIWLDNGEDEFSDLTVWQWIPPSSIKTNLQNTFLRSSGLL